MPKPYSSSLLFTATNIDEVKILIKIFNVNSATGPCSMPAKILNIWCDSIAHPITEVANI